MSLGDVRNDENTGFVVHKCSTCDFFLSSKGNNKAMDCTLLHFEIVKQKSTQNSLMFVFSSIAIDDWYYYDYDNYSNNNFNCSGV